MASSTLSEQKFEIKCAPGSSDASDIEKRKYYAPIASKESCDTKNTTLNGRIDTIKLNSVTEESKEELMEMKMQ